MESVQTPKFKTLPTGNNFIEMWGLMDGLIHACKPHKIVAQWERDGTPEYTRYTDIQANRYLYANAFEQDSPNRICTLFATLMAE